MNALVRRDLPIRDEVQSFCWQSPQSFRSYPLAIVRKVGKTQDRRVFPRSLVPENGRVVRPKAYQPASSKFRCSFSHLDHPLKSSKDLSRYGIRVLPLFKPGLIKLGPVDPSRIVPLVRFGHVRIIIECAQFVAKVKQRDPSGGHDDRVHQQYPSDRPGLAGFETAQRSARPGDPAVPLRNDKATLVSVQRHGIFVSGGTDGLWVVLEWYPSSETSRMTIDKERIEEFPMLASFFT